MMKTFMRQALEEAFKGMRSNEGGPFGAVIIRGGEVIARAHNRVIAECDPTAHAEIVAIRSAAAQMGHFHLPDCELYSTCEPCPMCLAAALWARIPRIYFGCTREDAHQIGFSDKDIYDFLQAKGKPHLIDLISLGREECLSSFHEWTEKNDKVRY
jgi:guanine deaminase